MTIPDVRQLENLSAWETALTSLCVMERDESMEIFDQLRAMSIDERDKLDSAIRDEVDRRAEEKVQEAADTILNAPDLDASDPDYRAYRFRQGVARLLRLIDLKAPDVILDHSYRILSRWSPLVDETIEDKVAETKT